MINEDPIDNFFSGLDDYYPGSKKKRKSLGFETPKSTKQSSDDWDAEPQLKKLPNGKEIELFSAGAFAQALNRPLVTIRLWERRGYIPRAPYRLKSMMVKGEKKPGWRMYSRTIIESTINSFKEHNLFEAKRIDWDSNTDLSIELMESWMKIHDQETN